MYVCILRDNINVGAMHPLPYSFQIPTPPHAAPAAPPE